MDLTINVYLTTKNDSLPDLKTYKTEDEFYQWKNQVRGVAFHKDTFTEISDALTTEAAKYDILEAYALIEYPTGKVLDADEMIGEKFRKFFSDKHVKFDWALTRDEQVMEDTYNVSLELIVDKQ